MGRQHRNLAFLFLSAHVLGLLCMYYSKTVISTSNTNTSHVPIQLTPNITACFIITLRHPIPNLSDPMKAQVYQNTAHMYAALQRHITAFVAIFSPQEANHSSVFSPVKIWLDAGHAPDTILNSSSIETNIFGTPVFQSLIQHVDAKCADSAHFIAYANADILFDDSLVQSLQALKAWIETQQHPHKIMVVGQRSNHWLKGPLRATNLSLLPSELFVAGAQDYFVLSRNYFSSMQFPKYVIGRPSYDNSLVDWAYHHATLIDATLTLNAVHQTTAAGNAEGHSPTNPDYLYNIKLSRQDPDHRFTDNAHFKTLKGLDHFTVHVVPNLPKRI